jgi:SPP1 family predicted phage head-tail adaptor
MAGQIGDMRWRLTLYNAVRTDDGAGGFTRTDGDEATVSASIRPASPREISAAAKLEQRLTHVIKIRWTDDMQVRQGMRVRWTDRRQATRDGYVEAVQDDEEAGRFFTLYVREGGPL